MPHDPKRSTTPPPPSKPGARSAPAASGPRDAELYLVGRPGAPPVALKRAAGLLLIGSAAGVQLRLNAPDVAPNHAAILCGGDEGYWLFDLASPAGTRLNDALAARESRLRDGDAIRVGPFAFRFVQPAPATETTEISSPVPPATFAMVEAGAASNGQPSMTVMADRRAVVIGSRASCDLVLPGTSAGVTPDVQAVVYVRAGRHMIRRAAGADTLQVDGKDVAQAALRPGARVCIGPVEIEYRTARPAVGAPAVPPPATPPPPPPQTPQEPPQSHRDPRLAGPLAGRVRRPETAFPPKAPPPPPPSAPPARPSVSPLRPPPAPIKPRTASTPRPPTGKPTEQASAKPMTPVQRLPSAAPPPRPAPDATASSTARQTGATAAAPGRLLRPVVGRRARPVQRAAAIVLAGTPVEPPEQIEGAGDDAAAPGVDAGPPRSSLSGLYLTMLLCMAFAALAVWRTAAPQYVIRGSITFEGTSATAAPLLAQRATLGEIETSLFADEVLRAAARHLAAVASGAPSPQSPPSSAAASTSPAVRPAPRSGDTNAGGRGIDLGFLDRPGDLRRRATLAWQPSAVGPGRAALVVSLRSPEPVAEVARVTAWLTAFYESRAAAATRPTGERLKLDLLRSEVDSLTQDIAFRRRQAEQVRREIQSLEASTPSDQQIELAERRRAALQSSLDAAVETRVVAEMRLRATVAAATTQRRTGSAATKPDSTSARERQGEAERARAEEERVRKELAEAMTQAGDLRARAERLGALRQRLGAGQEGAPQLEARLAAKSRELARADRDLARGAVTALPPGEAQAVREEDVRPLWIAGAVGAVAVVFGGVMVLATRGGGRGDMPH